MLSLKWVCWIPTAHTSLYILLHSKCFCGNGILPVETLADLAYVPVYCWMKLFNHTETTRRSLINGWNHWAWDFLCLCLVFNLLLSLRDVNKPKAHVTIAKLSLPTFMWIVWLHIWTGIRCALGGGDKDLEHDWKQLVHGASVCGLSTMTFLHDIFKAAFRPMLFSAGTDCTN